MKRLFTTFVFALFLSACTPDQGPLAIHLDQRLENPLFAEHFAKILVLRMTEIEIQKDPILEDEKKRRIVEETKKHWMEVDREARKIQREGISGEFIGIKEYALGEVLLLDSMLYIGPTFELDTGPEVHLFLSNVIDPRDIEFPDEESLSLGPLQSPFGAQRYELPPELDLSVIRTVVLWDMKLERILGFAQLS